MRTLGAEDESTRDLLRRLASRLRFDLPVHGLLSSGSTVEWAWDETARWAVARALPNPSFYVFVAEGHPALLAACCDVIAATGGKTVRFAAVEQSLHAGVVGAMVERGFALGKCHSRTAHSCVDTHCPAYSGAWDTYVNANNEHDKTRPAAHHEAGVVRALSADDAELINGEWEHRSESSLDVIRECISNRPSGGCYINGVLVAWALHRVDGSIGVVGCREQYRRQGLTTHVVGHVLAQLAGPVYVNIDRDNAASIRLHEKLGFRSSGVKLCWLRVAAVE